ncbi:MAG: hypothetical protein H8E17_18040 [Deltaproteobacteria bacterium]|nr:hypothetical protein [Deltaproteobacteria bacterium]
MSRRRFNFSEKDAMCWKFGISLEQLCNALLRVGPSALKEDLQSKWTPDNPCCCFCYRVTEAIVKSRKVPEGFDLMLKKDNGGHWFFKNLKSGEILDPTADQFEDGYEYDGAKRRKHFPQISIGARMVAEELGWTIPNS